MTDPDPLNRFLFRHTNWLGLGTDTEETDYPGYARQRIMSQIRFPRVIGFLDADITHLQVWTAETGGEMLAIGKLPHELRSGDDLDIPANTLFY